jgi:hypothetical protein
VLPLGEFVEYSQQVDTGKDVTPAVGGTISTFLQQQLHIIVIIIISFIMTVI